MLDVHFIDVGIGNMTLIILPEGSIFIYDCNITNDNKDRVLGYLQQAIGRGTTIDVFITSHRDADHMRGIKDLHSVHPINQIWDAGVPGTTLDSPEYRAYMELRQTVKSEVIDPRKFWTYGDAKIRCMNSHWDDYSDANDQSVVLKLEYKTESVMLGGDTTFRPWKEKILPFYSRQDLNSSLLLAAHHGSITFFDDPADNNNYYTEHIIKISPAMTLISVGPNVHGLPDDKAVQLYIKYSSGSNQGNKVYTTEDKGTMKLTLKDDGGWSLSDNQ